MPTLLIALGVLAGAAGGYATRRSWLPILFPEKPAKPATVEAEPKPASAPASSKDDDNDKIVLSDEARTGLKLRIAKARPRAYWRTISVPALVIDRPGETDRNVSSQFGGIVREIRIRPGDTVRPGDPLFVIRLTSELLQTTQADLARAARELSFATRKRDRSLALVRQGLKPEGGVLDEENAVGRSASVVSTLRRQLSALGLTSEQLARSETGELLTEIVVTAPAIHSREIQPVSTASASPPAPTKPEEPLYEVQELKVQPGQIVPPGSLLCVLSDHQTLFLEGYAFKSEGKRLAQAAKEGRPIEADFHHDDDRDWPAMPPLTVRHLSNIVDPLTHTLSFYVTLENQSDSWTRDGRKFYLWRFRPGQHARLKIPVEKIGDAVYVVPVEAVVREGVGAYIFHREGNAFERIPVTVLHQDRLEYVLAEGGELKSGTQVVLNNAVALNRAMKAKDEGVVKSED